MLKALFNKLRQSGTRHGIKNFDQLPPSIQDEILSAMEARSVTDIR